MSPKHEPPVSEPVPVRRDQTARFRKLAREEVGSVAGALERKVRRAKFWFSLVVTVAGAGFWFATYLSKDSERIRTLEVKFDDMKEQIREIAHTVGARETMRK